MQKIFSIINILVFSILVTNCSSDVEELNPNDLVDLNEVEADGLPTSQAIPRPEFSITATIDGQLTNLNNVPSGRAQSLDREGEPVVVLTTQEVSPSTGITLTIQLNRKDLKLGNVDLDNSIGGVLGAKSFIQFTSLSKAQEGLTTIIEGATLTITNIDTVKGIVAGTFQIDVKDTRDLIEDVASYKITDGSFYFVYDVQ